MFQASSFARVDAQKAVVHKELRALHEKLQSLEDDLGDEEESTYFDRYEAISVQIHKLKNELLQLRLRGGQFRLATKQTLEVSTDGQLVWSKEKRSLEPQVPPDMSKYKFCRLEIDVDDDGREVFVTRLSTIVDYAENIRSIRKSGEADDSKKWSGKELILEWRRGRSPVVVKCDDEEQQQELELVLGCQLQRFSRAKLVQVEELRRLWRDMKVPFSQEDHSPLLEELWERVFPEEKLEGLVSAQWSKLGFQGKNPGTDFRGSGLLGLQTLLYMARHHVDTIRLILDMAQEYPFATAGINVTFALTTKFLGLKADLMKHAPTSSTWNSSLLTFMCNADVENCFEETFCQFMLVLNATFVDMKAGYMDFPHVMARATRQMEDLLDRRPLSLKQLQAWIQTEVLFIHGSQAGTS